MRPGEGQTAAPAEGPASPDGVGQVLGRGSLYTIATAVQLASGLLTIPILTRILDPAEYGTVTAGLVVQAVLVNVAAFGMPFAIARAWFRGGGPPAGRALIAVTFAGALVVGAIAYATGPLWAGLFEGVGWGTVLQLAVVASVPAAVLLSAQVALQAAASVRGFLISAAIATLGAQALGVALAATAGGAGAYMAGIAIGYALAAAAAWFAAGIDFSALRRDDADTTDERDPRGADLIRRSLAIALPTVPHGLALYLLSAADRIIVERLEGLPEAGAYYVAYAIGSLAIFLVAGLNGAWQPIIFGAEDEGRWSFVSDSAVEILRVVAVAVAAVAIGAPVALAGFAPADYDIAGLGTVSAIVALSAIPYLAYLSSANLIIWRGRTLTLAAATPISVAFNIGLCFALIPPLGLEGAALATIAAYVLLSLLLFAWSGARTRIPWDARRLAIACLPALAGFAVALALPDDDAWLVVRGVMACGLAGLALARLTAERRAMGAEAPAS